jgi:hypothetical protein
MAYRVFYTLAVICVGICIGLPGCGCSAIRRSSLGGVPGQRWHAGRGQASQGKLALADTAYASEKPVCAVDLTLPGCFGFDVLNEP